MSEDSSGKDGKKISHGRWQASNVAAQLGFNNVANALNPHRTEDQVTILEDVTPEIKIIEDGSPTARETFINSSQQNRVVIIFRPEYDESINATAYTSMSQTPDGGRTIHFFAADNNTNPLIDFSQGLESSDQRDLKDIVGSDEFTSLAGLKDARILDGEELNGAISNLPNIKQFENSEI